MGICSPAILVLAAALQAPPAESVARLDAWMEAVERHEPGTDDAPARSIGAWPPFELREFAADLAIFLDVLDDAHAITPRRRTLPRPSRPRPGPVIDAIHRRARNLATRQDWDVLLKRAALLHADVATLVPRELTSVPPTSQQADPRRRPRASSGPIIIQTEDGVALDFGHGTLHWDLGRALLDSTSAYPARDDMVRAWYRATTAYLLHQEQYAYAVPHLSVALRVIPDDARLLFYAGALHETFAGPLVQVAARGIESHGNIRSDVGAVENELERAETFFRRSLAAEPDFADARLRLGRVLGLLGRPKDASAELQRALLTLSDKPLVYYAELFLGREEAVVGRRDAARDHLERAASLYPRAQSPRLALGLLARAHGDRTAAIRSVQEVFSWSSDGADREDPWWEYYRSHVRDTDKLLESLRRPFLTGAKP